MMIGDFWVLRRVALVRTDVSEVRSIRRFLVAACVVPSSPIFFTLMKEAQGSSETSVLTRATRRDNPEDTILEVELIALLSLPHLSLLHDYKQKRLTILASI
jgi:hypothetical protein